MTKAKIKIMGTISVEEMTLMMANSHYVKEQFWWVHHDTRIKCYHLPSSMEDKFFIGVINVGKTPLFKNYWFAWAYQCQCRAAGKEP